MSSSGEGAAGYRDIVAMYAEALHAPAQISEITLAMAEKLVRDSTADQRMAALTEVYEARVAAGELAPASDHIDAADLPYVAAFLQDMEDFDNPGAVGFNYVEPAEEQDEPEGAEVEATLPTADLLAGLTLEPPTLPPAPKATSTEVPVTRRHAIRAIFSRRVPLPLLQEAGDPDSDDADLNILVGNLAASAQSESEPEPAPEPTHGRGWPIGTTTSHWTSARPLPEVPVLFTDGTIGVVPARLEDGEILPNPTSKPLPPAPGQRVIFGMHDPIESMAAAIEVLRRDAQIPEEVKLPELLIGATFRQASVRETLARRTALSLGERLPELVERRAVTAPAAEAPADGDPAGVGPGHGNGHVPGYDQVVLVDQ